MKIEVKDMNILDKDYLRNYLLSPDFLARLYATASGTRQANLSSRTILTLGVIFPKDKEKQIQIVRILDQVRKYTSQIEREYLSQIENLEDLKKSLLQKAFSGELTKADALV